MGDRRRHGFLTVLLALLIQIPSATWAAEVRVVDERGLLRAVRSVKSKAQILIKIQRSTSESSSPKSLTLTSADGIAGDVEAAPQSEGEYRASGIEGGTWKILAGGKSIVVTKVTIEEGL